MRREKETGDKRRVLVVLFLRGRGIAARGLGKEVKEMVRQERLQRMECREELSCQPVATEEGPSTR